MSKVVFPWVWDGSKPVKLLGKPDGAAVVAPRPKLKLATYSWDTPITAGSNSSISIFAPSGKVWRVKNLRIYVPSVSGASSGTHRVEASSYPTLTAYLYGRSNYNAAILFTFGYWRTANVAEFPPDRCNQPVMMHSICMSDSVAFRAVYYNNTDADQTETCTIYILVEETDEEP